MPLSGLILDLTASNISLIHLKSTCNLNLNSAEIRLDSFHHTILYFKGKKLCYLKFLSWKLQNPLVCRMDYWGFGKTGALVMMEKLPAWNH